MKKKIETTETLPQARRPMSRVEAEAEGYTIDATVYPWFAYKGPRSQPTATQLVMTDAEASMFDQLAHQVKILEYFGLVYAKATIGAKLLLLSIGSTMTSGQRWSFVRLDQVKDPS